MGALITIWEQIKQLIFEKFKEFPRLFMYFYEIPWYFKVLDNFQNSRSFNVSFKTGVRTRSLAIPLVVMMGVKKGVGWGWGLGGSRR